MITTKPRVLSKSYWALGGLTAAAMMPEEVNETIGSVMNAVGLGAYSELAGLLVKVGFVLLGIVGRETASRFSLSGIFKTKQ